MRLYFVGVPCVGKSTIGKLVADRLRYPFVDFDLEVEKRMGQHIEALKASCVGLHPESEYREKVKHILAEVLEEHPIDLVVSMPPGGMFGQYSEILHKHPDIVTIELQDDPINILNRIVFFDEETKPIAVELDDKSRAYYLRDIQRDILYYKVPNQKVQMHFHLHGMSVSDAADALILEITVKSTDK
jgi:shikimate kinase